MEIETATGSSESTHRRSHGYNSGISLKFPKGSEVILFVDDEILLTQLGADMLERMGYRTKTCTNGTKALAFFKCNPNDYDLLIADLFMPEMSGLVLAAECKMIRPDFPVIISSGHSFLDSGHQEKIDSLNIAAILNKPYSFIDLAYVVRSVLGKQSKEIPLS